MYYIKKIKILLLLSVVFLFACSTQKNTRASRFYHATTTKYNIYFNGITSYDEGIEAINKANIDDFSDVINLYPISNHEAAQAATSQMDRTIEKCRKSIKLHSIKAKPKIDSKRRNDPDYKLFLQQEEYNRQIDKAWQLLAKAEFHKGDFIGSVGTFNYIIRHYQNDKDIVAQCQLWTVRAYSEMGWIYEAEDLFQKVKQDDLSRKNAWLYSAIAADLRLKQKQYQQALPFLKIALPEEKKSERIRYVYVQAQIYELHNDRKAAQQLYRKVLKMSPSAEMDFNARMHYTSLTGDLKALNKMAKQSKNKDRLDYIYGTIADIYIEKKDTLKALEFYTLAAEKSTQAANQKAKVLICAANIYYEQRKYEQAAPLYQEAVNIISAERADYNMLRRRAETLTELAAETAVVALQDSLQLLSTYSEEKQMQIAQQIIADLEKAEKEAAEKAEQEAREALNNTGLTSVNTQNMLGGGGGNTEWYFYNANLLRQGKQQFFQRWGNRKLEDHWRRSIKTMQTTSISSPTDSIDLFINDTLLNTSNENVTQKTLSSDPKDPQYYLQQIPKTEEDIKASNELIATALINMVGIYYNKIEDASLADETLKELNKRFPHDDRLADLYYMMYLDCMKKSLQDSTQDDCSLLRQTILSRYPDSEYASIVADKSYFNSILQQLSEQDSIYKQTYFAFKRAQYKIVRSNVQYADSIFPSSPLMPRFLFLDAISVAKTENQEAFVNKLRQLVERYPESEQASMSKDMLAMMNEGLESHNSNDTTSLIERRSDSMLEGLQDDLREQSFSSERAEQSVVLIIAAVDEQELNYLLYQIALFNFTQFLIKDFDLTKLMQFNVQESAIKVSGMESYDEALWYSTLMQNNQELIQLFTEKKVTLICITENNFKLINTKYTIDEYQQFQRENNLLK